MAASTNGNHTILHGWIWSRNSNVSVVKEGGLFVEGSYVPFQSAVHKHLEFTEKRRVAGVGTVCIPISMPSAEGDHRHLVMYVEEVLHVPTASYNILCHEDLMKSYEVLQPSHSSADPATIIDRRNNIGIATFDTPNPLLCPRFKLSGSPILLPLGDLDFTSAKWTDKERARWECFKFFSEKERKWIRRYHQDEYIFMRFHNLPVDNVKHLEEGRNIVWKYMP